MRYYDLKIINAESGEIMRQWSSLYLEGPQEGNFNPNSQNIEIDVTAYNYAAPMGSSNVRIWGISLEDIGQTGNWNQQILVLQAGMSKGLPLANPSQKGPILEGQIFQAIGNWQAAVLTIDFMVVYGVTQNPNNLVWQWKKGTNLSDSIKLALETAYKPPTNIKVDITQDIVSTQDQQGNYPTLTNFAQSIRTISQKAIKDANYLGVQIALNVNTNTIEVYDGTVANPVKTLEFNDLIGQPTWLNFQTISFKTVLRHDLSLNTYVKMPPAAFQQTAKSYPAFRNTAILQNNFIINQMRHVGNFRQPDGNSWVTIFNAIQAPQ